MPRETRAQAVARADSESEQANLLRQALDDVLAGRVEFTTTTTLYQGARYRYSLLRSTGAAGGIVLVTFKCRGQRDSTSVVTLDRLADQYRGNHDLMNNGCLIALDRLLAERQRRWDAEVAS